MYDVFISCKSEDYQYAEEIYDFLKSNGITAFLASKELENHGESKYREVITNAVNDAYHLIVFASKAEYFMSNWVKFEWDTFMDNWVEKGRITNIVTILKGVSPTKRPNAFRGLESFVYEEYQNKILPYVETPDSIERRNALEMNAEVERQREELKAKLVSTAKEYKRSVAALKADSDMINGLLVSLNINERKCPACQAVNPLDNLLCSQCGWYLSPIDGIEGLTYSIIARPYWLIANLLRSQKGKRDSQTILIVQTI